MKYVMALDAGTTHIKGALYDPWGSLFAQSSRKVEVHYPASGHVEQDPEEIYRESVLAIQDVLRISGVAADQVAALGITSQRNTVILWDRKSGRPVQEAISWQDPRGPEMAPGILARGGVDAFLASQVAGKRCHAWAD